MENKLELVSGFDWCGYIPAMQRRSTVLEVCNKNGWKFICMQPGRRYVIIASGKKYYWTYKEVMEEGVKNGANRVDTLQAGSNSLLADRTSDKISMVRSSGRV